MFLVNYFEPQDIARLILELMKIGVQVNLDVFSELTKNVGRNPAKFF